jgi:hypothetical protein
MSPTHLAGVENSALSLLTALPGLLLAALSWLLLSALSWLLFMLARLLLSAAALLAALVLLAGLLFIRVLVHNCSSISSLATTNPRPLSFLGPLVRKRTLLRVKARVGSWEGHCHRSYLQSGRTHQRHRQ